MSVRSIFGVLLCACWLFGVRARTGDNNGDRNTDCSGAVEPSQGALKRQLRQFRQLDDQPILGFSIHPAVHQRMLLAGESMLTSKHYSNSRLRTTAIFGNRKCPKEIKEKGKFEMDRSTCPWFIEFNVDTNRYPRYKLAAKCKCKSCLETKQNNETKCKPFGYTVRVLRKVFIADKVTKCERQRGRKKVVFLYEGALEYIAVGCSCVATQVVVGQTLSNLSDFS